MTSELARIVVVGASAGGVAALCALLSKVELSSDVAIFVVMHVPSHTRSHLADILGASTMLPVRAAVDGEPILGGQIYVASADRHLAIVPGRVRLTRGPRECRSRPSVDVLFRSAAVAYGPRVIGVVLSGALDDGTAGLWAIKENGGVAMAQEPSTAEFSSMPQSAIDQVDVDVIAPLESLGGLLNDELSKRPDARPVLPASEGHKKETVIALEGNGLQAGVMHLGAISQYTCPDCHGVLVQITEGPVVRFRCHTGHAFSSMTLLAEVNEAIDKGLWDTLRAIEERILLLEQLATIARDKGDDDAFVGFARQAEKAKARVESIRSLVLDPELFGHDPK